MSHTQTQNTCVHTSMDPTWCLPVFVSGPGNSQFVSRSSMVKRMVKTITYSPDMLLFFPL